MRPLCSHPKRYLAQVAVVALLGGLLVGITPALAVEQTQPVAQTQPVERRIQLLLSAPPVTALRVHFEQAVTGLHRTVEWDPDVSGALSKYVVLESGEWRVSLVSDARSVPTPNHAANDLLLQISLGAWTNGDPSSDGRWSLTVPESDDPAALSSCKLKLQGATVTSMFSGSGQSSAPIRRFRGNLAEGTPSDAAAAPAQSSPYKGPGAYTLEISVAALPTLAAAKRGLTMSSELGASGRGLEDAAPKAVVELFQVLGEIAVERAKSQGFSLLSERIKAIVCQDLPKGLENALQKETAAAFSVDESKLPKLERALLSNTCSVVSNLRLQDLETIRKPLLAALMRDLGDLGLVAVMTPAWVAVSQALPEVAAKDQLKKVLSTFESSLRALVMEQRPLDNRDAQRLLIGLSKVSWSSMVNSDAARPIGCGLELAFGIMATCLGQGEGCDAGEVARMVANPTAYFDTEQCKDSLQKQLGTSWPDFARFVDRGIEVLSPPRGSSARSQAKASLMLSLDIVERILATRSVPKNALLVLTAARTFAGAAIDGNVPEMIVTLGGLLQSLSSGLAENQQAAVKKGLQLVSAITAYASSYSDSSKGDEKQLHEARKKAVENLIDAAANRSERHGEWVFSLGANVGAALIGGQYLPSQSGFSAAYPQLVLPIGVAAQWLPQGAMCGHGKTTCRHYVGFHAQISPIDLGQFVSYDGNFQITSTRWSNFVAVSTQFAFLFGKPATPFVLGLDIRFAPTLFSQEQTTTVDGATMSTDRGGMFRFGLFFGYYVPFFDFN